MSEFNYESIPAGYYDQVFRLERGVQSKWHHLKFKFFTNYIREGDHILDIGCGPGTFLGNLGNNFSRAVGADISQSQIDYANENYQDSKRTFLAFDGNRLPYEDASFNVVTLVEVIEHLAPSTVENLLSEAYRLLKPRGRLYLSTPNYGSLWPLLEKIVNSKAEVTYEEQHINLYKRQRLQSEIVDAGFPKVKVRAYQFAAPFLASASWSLADAFYQIDKGILSSRVGFLLFASATKE